MTALLLPLALLGCAKQSGLPTLTIEVGGHPLTVEVADDDAERSQGLMYRKSLGAEDGMLFVYPVTGPRSFWMANTTIPLSIAFVDVTGRIVNIEPMTPLDRSPVRSASDALYAIEVNRGWFDEKGVAQGAVVTGLPGASSE